MAIKTSRLSLVIAGDNKGGVKAVDGMEKSLGGLQGKLGGLGAGLAGAFSVGAVVAFGKASVDAYSTIAGNVAQIRRLTGESAEDASLLAFAAQQSGIDAGKASVGWRTLAKNIDSGKVAAEGIATQDANGRLLKFDQILGNVADRIQDLPPGFQRTAIAQRLFGKSGADMVKVLANGSAGIEEQRKEMQAYGLEFSDAGLEKYQKFVQAQRDMKAATMGLQVEIGEKVVPVLTKLAEASAWFGRLPEPVKASTEAVVGLGLATTGLALAVGALGPSLSRGLVTLHLKSAAEAEAATATGLHAAAAEAAAVAAATEAQAQVALTAALTAGGAAEAEFALAAEAQAIASVAATEAAAAQAAAVEGLAVAAGTATVAATGLITKLALVETAGLAAVALVNKKHEISFFDTSAAGVEKFAKETAYAKDELEAFNGGVSTLNKGELKDFLHDIGAKSPAALYRMRKALGDDYDAASPLGDAIANLSDAQRAGAKATDKATAATERQTQSLKEADDAATAKLDAVEGLRSAEDSYADSAAESVQATYELGVAQQAATGNSDEYRDALKDVADANEDVTAAEEKVGDAQRDVRDSLADLSQEREDATQRIIDYADAARDAALAEADANLKVKEARQELARVNADPRSTAIDKERAALAVQQAESDATSAKHDNTKAQQDNDEAKRRGIEGDAEVVRARQAVADANKGVTDAEHDLADARGAVAEAEKSAAKVIADARAEVLVAQQKANDATIAEVDSFGKLLVAQEGGVQGLRDYRTKLREIYDDLDPASPLALRIARLMHDVTAAISAGTISNAGTNTPPTRNPDAGLPTSDGAGSLKSGDIRSGGGGGDLRSPTTVVAPVFNIAINGTSRQAANSVKAGAVAAIDEIVRRVSR